MRHRCLTDTFSVLADVAVAVAVSVSMITFTARLYVHTLACITIRLFPEGKLAF